MSLIKEVSLLKNFVIGFIVENRVGSTHLHRKLNRQHRPIHSVRLRLYYLMNQMQLVYFDIHTTNVRLVGEMVDLLRQPVYVFKNYCFVFFFKLRK